jgi:carboxylesterase type B
MSSNTLRHILLLLLVSLALAGPIATVLNGTYEGYHLSPQNQDIFLGIPYARPPVGNLRFRGPQSLNTTWVGTKNVTQYGPVVSCEKLLLYRLGQS